MVKIGMKVLILCLVLCVCTFARIVETRDVNDESTYVDLEAEGPGEHVEHEGVGKETNVEEENKDENEEEYEMNSEEKRRYAESQEFLKEFHARTKQETTEEDEKTKYSGGSDIVIGIDLGTTYSCACWFESGESTMVADEYGRKTFPSVLSYMDDGRILVGHEAKQNMAENPNVFYDSKRMLGRTWEDFIAKTPNMKYPFKLFAKETGKEDPITKIIPTTIQYEFIDTRAKGSKTQLRRLYAEQISCEILRFLRDLAEKSLQRRVAGAVITVPAYFNDRQRKATKFAADLAKLKVLRLINEPTAAAIHYGLTNEVRTNDGRTRERYVFVFDLGGGTFDVSLLAVEDQIYEVLSTHGDASLGGQDFDNDIMKVLVDEIKRLKSIDLYAPKNVEERKTFSIALQRLKIEAEKAKINLSTVERHRITIENLLRGFTFDYHLTRAQLNNSLKRYIPALMSSIEECLKIGQKKPAEVDDVVLIGGSSRIPLFREMLKKYFGASKIRMDVNPDEAVARGAAIQAAVITRTTGTAHDVVVLDVTPMDVGIEVMGGLMSVMLPKKSAIPYEKEQVFTTASDNQTSVSIVVYQGSRPHTKDNLRLGSFDVHGIPPAPRGVPQIVVKFKVDVDGIYEVLAYDKNNPEGKKSIKIEQQDRQLSDADVKRMQDEAEQHAEDDARLVAAITKLNTFESQVYGVKQAIENKAYRARLSQDEIKTLDTEIQKQIAWIREVDRASLRSDVVVEREREFNEIIQPITMKMHAQAEPNKPEGEQEQSPWEGQQEQPNYDEGL